jgi:hypothetical protein
MASSPLCTCDHAKRTHRRGRFYCRAKDCKCSRFVKMPDPATLRCPRCRKLHVDQVDSATGIDWARRPHSTHGCVDDAAGKGCGKEWEVELPRVRGVLPAPDAPYEFGVYYDELDAPDGSKIFIEELNADYERHGNRWRMC